MTIKKRTTPRQRVHARIRERVRGTQQRPRLAVFRSTGHIYAQAIDDETGKTLAAFSSNSTEARTEIKGGGNIAAAKAIGHKLAEKLKEKGITRIVFDRGGFKYHGRVKALAEALREKGIEF
jgi:large subunit ribosomal protein L18